MIANSQVGPPASSIAPGVQPALRSGNLGDLIVQELHGRYYESAYRKAIFSAANPTGVTGTAFVSGATTVFLGLCLSNPIGSTVNLVLNKVGYACVVAPASEAIIALGVGSSASNVTHTTPLTVRSNFIGQPVGQGLVDSSYTVPTAPAIQSVLGILGTGAATVSIVTPSILVDLEGSVILPPGAYAIVASLVAAGASGAFASVQWEEVPI